MSTETTEHDEISDGTQEGQEPPQEPANDNGGIPGPDGGSDGSGGLETPQETDEPDTFPREYVVRLRQEAADARVKAKRANDLGERLHTQLVAAAGRLADPTDLQYDEAHLDDEDALTAAVDELLSRKPHLASRRPAGDVGQGATGGSSAVDLAGMLRGLAG